MAVSMDIISFGSDMNLLNPQREITMNKHMIILLLIV